MLIKEKIYLVLVKIFQAKSFCNVIAFGLCNK